RKDLYVVPISVKDARTTGPADLVFKGWSDGAYNVVFSWSPDGNNLALVHEDEIWVVPLSGGKPTQITDTPEEERWIKWSPDGKMISYHVDAKTKRSLHVVPASGGKSTMVLDDCKTAKWSPSSEEFTVYSEGNISIITLDGKTIRHIVNQNDLDIDDLTTPKWSPDGKHLAFIGYKTGEEDRLFMIPAGGGRVTELAPDDNTEKYGLGWSPDGKWISYLTDEAVKVRPEGTMWEADFEEIVEKLGK
ncbi:MAG: DPP IV N-terminal domain-containing protein, partial [Bacteroidales bacterium]